MAAWLQLRHLRREFPAGDETLVALNDIDLDIEAGDMVAIVGQSGSGKSTLMNILGCLDQPTAGSYCIGGRDVSTLTADERAALRREHFGFIFQRYHLLSDIDALGNVSVPAIYAGTASSERHHRARDLLARLGLQDRLRHKPSQLSGGQQQRVSIARALINGGDVILADEPTGALDSHSGEEVMAILKQLNDEGHTVITVTHDMAVARHARRIIEFSDGVVVADRATDELHRQPPTVTAVTSSARRSPAARYAGFVDALRMAMLAMNAHRLRTCLTMLGIIIGIASVVSVVALGKGSQQQILANIASLGTNTISVYPGRGFGDLRSGRVSTLKAGDARALAQQPYVDSATPNVDTSVTARFGDVAANASVGGVGAQYFRVQGMTLLQGRLFDAADVRSVAQVAVIDDTTRDTLFPNQQSPLGQVVLLDRVPVRIIGVVKASGRHFRGGSSLSVWTPYTTVMWRMLGDQTVSGISVRVADGVSMAAAEQALTQLLIQRHGSKDFFTRNTQEIRDAIESTIRIMTLLISSIAAIALIVGGIGVMNIMLVSVAERTREIGVRMAVGARQSDVMQQFLIEAVLVCLLGGFLGVLLALAIGWLFALMVSQFQLLYSGWSIVAAFACATLIGVAFGFLPARNAARLDPVEALARE